MWGERSVTDRMVMSVLHQFIGRVNSFKVELVLVDDYLEGRGEGDESPYEYYLSDEFKQFYDTKHFSIKLIKNSEHKYQGESREIGFMAGKYDWFILLDCDDMLAPNCCERYRYIIDTFYAKDENGKRIEKGNLACVYGYLYSFDENGYENNIIGESIWVQSRCYNRKFVVANQVHFPTGLNSRQSEDYPFIRKFDYALIHDNRWVGVKIPYGEGNDCQATAYWFPNADSLSRQRDHYECHLAGWTMASSNSILEYIMWYNKEHGIEEEQDEYMKHEVLNMMIYAWYNLLHFIKKVACDCYKPVEDDWNALRINVAAIKKKLKDVYWEEIVYNDVVDMLYEVRHHSDVNSCEPWQGTFFDFMNKGFKDHKGRDLLDISLKELLKYCDTLEFDVVGHEIHSPQVRAWIKRHGIEDS